MYPGSGLRSLPGEPEDTPGVACLWECAPAEGRPGCDRTPPKGLQVPQRCQRTMRGSLHIRRHFQRCALRTQRLEPKPSWRGDLRQHGGPVGVVSGGRNPGQNHLPVWSCLPTGKDDRPTYEMVVSKGGLASGFWPTADLEILLFLSLSFSLPFPLSKTNKQTNKQIKSLKQFKMAAAEH